MRRKSGNKKSGFTLVEVIVVLVILGVLAVILIPSLTGWIDKAKDKQAVCEAKSCVTAAQTIATELFAKNKTYDLSINKEETLSLAEAPSGSDIQQVSFSDKALLTKMVYKASNELIVTYENGEYSSSKTGGTDFSDSSSLSKIYGIINQVLGSPNGKYYYSGTNDGDKIAAALKAEGIDLDSLANNWSVRYNRSNEYPKMYWTNTDLTGYSAGDVVPVMAYTLTTGRYTVWNVRLVNNNGKLCLGSEVSMVTTVGSENQSYEQMLIDYKAAVDR